jgi:magnesium transporter
VGDSEAGSSAGDRVGVGVGLSNARQGLQQNTDMRKMAAYAALLAVPTALAGIYGMNFEHMPELSWRFGYPAVLLVMATILTLMFRAFKRSGWL